MQILLFLLLIPLFNSSCVLNCDPSFCSGNICSKCIDGYNYDSNNRTCYAICPNEGTFFRNGSCINCSTGCSTCLNETVCYDCLLGYYLNNSFQCIKCEPGFRFDYSQKSCVTCPSSYCDECDSYECLTCAKDKYSLSLYISEGDLKCQNNFYCRKCLDKCPSGYIAQPDKTCFPCSLGCANCYSFPPYACYNCTEGYYLELNRCQPCGCDNCNSNYISCDTTCIKKYYAIRIVARAFCVPCLIRNCDDCLDDICNNCSAGYFKDSSNACKPCSKLHCTECTNDVCSACEDGYTYNSETKNCRSNFTYTCNPGFYFDYDYYECRQCSTSNCYICPDNKCTQCYFPYELSNKTQLCLSFTCPQGKYFNKSLEACVGCADSNCTNCTDNVCSSCKSGYYLNTLKRCNITNDIASGDNRSNISLALILIITIPSTILIIVLFYCLVKKCKRKNSSARGELIANQNHIPSLKPLQPEIRIYQPQFLDYINQGQKKANLDLNSKNKEKNLARDNYHEKSSFEISVSELINPQEFDQAQKSDVFDHMSFCAEELPSFHAPSLKLNIEHPVTINASEDGQKGYNLNIKIERQISCDREEEEEHKNIDERIKIDEIELKKRVEMIIKDELDRNFDHEDKNDLVPIELKIDLEEEYNHEILSEENKEK